MRRRAIPARNRGRKRGEGSGEIAHVETKLRRQSSASIEWQNGETAAARVCARGRRLRLLGLDRVPGGVRAPYIGRGRGPWCVRQGAVQNSGAGRTLRSPWRTREEEEGRPDGRAPSVSGRVEKKSEVSS